MDPTQPVLPGGLFQAVLITMVACHSGSGAAARNDLIGIRLWSTMHSDGAGQAGHKAALPWSWAMGFVAVLSFAAGVWLVKQETLLSDAVTTWYSLSTVVSFLGLTGLMIWRAQVVAKNVAIDELLAAEANSAGHGEDKV